MNKTTKILITGYESLEEMYEVAYELLADEGYSAEDDGEDYFEQLANEEVDNIYMSEVDEILDAYDLEHWWRRNGWTLDRGYGGPNYKERVADETDWEEVYWYILDVVSKDPSFGHITMTPTEVNDLVVFWKDYEEGY